MDHDLTALRDLVLGDDNELATICTAVLTVLDYGGPLVETLEFNLVDVTLDRNERVVEFQGVSQSTTKRCDSPRNGSARWRARSPSR